MFIIQFRFLIFYLALIFPIKVTNLLEINISYIHHQLFETYILFTTT